MPKVSEAFVSESAYLKKEDIGDRRVAVTIESVDLETVGQGQEQEEKYVLRFVGKSKGMVLNKTNAETISEILGDDEMDNWAGHKITLYVDKHVMMAGKKVGGIRVMAYQPPKPVPGPKPVAKPVPAPVVEEEREPGQDDEIGF